jgi:N-acetylmuramoyl-L-alanine amidase CwlA
MTAWIDKFINVNQFARSGKKLTSVKKLVLHFTANNGGTALNHFNYFNNLKDRYASAHLFVDKLEALCIIPLNEVAYHCNDVQKRNADGTPWRGVKELLPNGNLLSIGVEMCMEKDGSFHPDMIARTVDVFVELCKKFNLDPIEDIVRHRDITWKNCPAPFVANEQLFIDFKNRVKAKLTPPVQLIQKEVKVEKVEIEGDDEILKLSGALKEIVKAEITDLTDETKFGKSALSKIWLDKFLKDELTVSEAVGLLYAAKRKGI